MSTLSRKGRAEITSGRLTVPVNVLEHAGFSVGNDIFIRAINGGLKLTRSTDRSIGRLAVDVDGRIKLSPTVLSGGGLNRRTVFNFVSNGRTVTVA